MRAAALVAVLVASAALAGEAAHDHFDGAIVLLGARTEVRWVDGDSFAFLGGPRKGKETRLVGYNTLESYGPAHRWGDWTPEELWGVSKAAARFAASHAWGCTTNGKKDGYGRVLVDCPQLREELVKRGLGHVFAYDEPADPALLELQKQARLHRVGMWSKGLPEEIVTSVHAAGRQKSGSMRVADARTGATRMVGHKEELTPCAEICHGDKWRGSCMIFVPYEQRYGEGRAACLRGEPPPWPPRGDAAEPAAAEPAAAGPAAEPAAAEPAEADDNGRNSG